MDPTYMADARVLQSGNSQVEILRQGDEVMLQVPKQSAAVVFDALAAMPDDFMSDGRDDALPQKRDTW